MVVCGSDFVMEVVVFCGTALFSFFCRKIFALHICKNCEQLHPLVSLLLSDEFDFRFGSIASIWSYEIHSDINLSFLITMNMVKQLSDLTDEKDCYWYQMQRWNCVGFC
ncbi:hypothetical protein P8452_34844 [Trifolium repens]|nr:hypothetical protein P8452_34844 [Trifolium repens]